MRMHFFAPLLAAGALLLAAVPVSFAADERPLDTTPELSHPSPMGYYLWRSDGTIHLRTHGPGAEHDFDAVLRTDGTFENVDAVRLDGADRIEVRDSGHEIVMHFHTF